MEKNYFGNIQPLISIILNITVDIVVCNDPLFFPSPFLMDFNEFFLLFSEHSFRGINIFIYFFFVKPRTDVCNQFVAVFLALSLTQG